MSVLSVSLKKLFSLLLFSIAVLSPLRVYALGRQLPYPRYTPPSPVKSKMKPDTPIYGLKNEKHQAKTNKAKKVNAQVVLPVRNAVKLNIKKSVPPVYLTVKKGETKTVFIARKFINRVVFPHYVKYARTSKTGDISVIIQGKEALISVTPYIVAKGPVKRAVFPKSISSAMFKVGHYTYSFLFIPKNMSPQTLYVNSMENAAAKTLNVSVKGGLGSYLYPVLKSVYNGIVPPSFTVSRKSIIYKSNYPQVGIKLIKKFNGNNLEIYEFIVKNKSGSPLSLSNKEFLYLEKDAVAVSVSSEHLFPKTYTRLFIVTRRMTHGG